MLLLSCTDLGYGYDATPLYEGVAFELHAGDRVGFVGPNGAGKTTLFKCLAGQLEPDAGEVRRHAGARLGVLLQVADFPAGRTLFHEAKSAFDELLATQDELHRVGDELAAVTDETVRKQLSATYDRLSEQLATNDAYALDHRVADVLTGLGFKEADYGREVRTFSGGQQRRLLLAKLLLSAPDVMLLDEPSNHLDIATTRWLEDYLTRQPQGMIVVSHDRYLLDKVTTRTFELHNKRVTAYPGNFQQYVRLRDEKFDRQMKEYTAQREYVEKQEEYIRRAHYGQLAKQAQSRAKALDKVAAVEKPTRVSGPHIHFGDVTRAGDIVFTTDDLTKRFGDKLLFENLNFALPRGKRLGIVGPNGCGKTTLLKTLNRLIEPDGGTIEINGRDVRQQRPEALRRGIGYAIQQVGLLPHLTVGQNIGVVPGLLGHAPAAIAARTAALLTRLQLPPARYAGQLPAQLSGGQQQRVGLARALAADPPIILLDEPFGALDPITRASIRREFRELEELKRKTVVLVTHDVTEAFELADRILLLDGGQMQQLGTPRELLFRPANDFVRRFFAAERLALQLRTLTLGDVWPADAPGQPKNVTSQLRYTSGLVQNTTGRAQDATGSVQDTSGLVQNTPGRAVDTPGCAVDTPGRAADTPGWAVDTPGCAVDTPGRAVDTPGRAVDTPGRVENTPSWLRDTPSRPENAPGQSGEGANQPGKGVFMPETTVHEALDALTSATTAPAPFTVAQLMAAFGEALQREEAAWKR